jgi:hypothetical protein
VRCLKIEGKTFYFGRIQDFNEYEVLDLQWMNNNGMGRTWRKRKLLGENIGKWEEVFN